MRRRARRSPLQRGRGERAAAQFLQRCRPTSSSPTSRAASAAPRRSSPRRRTLGPDHCESVTAKVDFQSKLLEPLLTPTASTAMRRRCGARSTPAAGRSAGPTATGTRCTSAPSTACARRSRRCVASTANWIPLVALLLVRGGRPFSTTGASNVLGDVDEATGTPDLASAGYRAVASRAAAAAPPPPRRCAAPCRTVSAGSRPPRTQHGWHKPIFAMSCALCASLHADFGAAPYAAAGGVPSPEHASTRIKAIAAHYGASLQYKVGYWDTWVGWDMHPFGVWYANTLWPSQVPPAAARASHATVRTPRTAHRSPPTAHLWRGRQLGDVEPTLSRIAEYRITNGEILHGFVWQSLIQLKKEQPWADPAEWVYRACGPVWKFDGPPGGEGVNRGSAATPQATASITTTATCATLCRRAAAPTAPEDSPEEFGEFWRTTCEGGCAAAVAATRHLLHLRHLLRHLHHHLRHLHRVYHSAFNSLSADDFRDIIRRGDAPSVWSSAPSGAYGAGGVLSITAALCKASAPGPCPVSLGADEAAGRLEIVRAASVTGLGNRSWRARSRRRRRRRRCRRRRCRRARPPPSPPSRPPPPPSPSPPPLPPGAAAPDGVCGRLPIRKRMVSVRTEAPARRAPLARSGATARTAGPGSCRRRRPICGRARLRCESSRPSRRRPPPAPPPAAQLRRRRRR